MSAQNFHGNTPKAHVAADAGAEFTLRKRKRGTETEDAPRASYQVLNEQAVSSKGFFGSDKVYDLKSAQRSNVPTLDQEDRYVIYSDTTVKILTKIVDQERRELATSMSLLM